MFEHKNNGQDEHNLPLSEIYSPEVTATNKKVTTYEEAWQAEPDGRTQEEIFEDLVKSIKSDTPNISDTDARQSARNLITYVKEIMKVAQGI